MQIDLNRRRGHSTANCVVSSRPAPRSDLEALETLFAVYHVKLQTKNVASLVKSLVSNSTREINADPVD